MNKKKMRLYVWENVLRDYYPGMVVVLAHNIKEAREVAAKSIGWSYTVEYFTENLPYVYDVDRKNPVCHAVHGGG